MDIYSLNVSFNSTGGYFSSEQLDLLSIIKCQRQDELIDFVSKCDQLKGIFDKDDMDTFGNIDLEELKRKVFKNYQDTLVPHNSDRVAVLDNLLERLEINQDDIIVIKKIYIDKKEESLKHIREYIKNKYPNSYEEIFKQAHHFVSTERDQDKSPNLYNEFVFLNEKLSMFDTILVGSLKPEVVMNKLFDENSKDRFDFYFVKRDLDFAYKNNKHARVHSLLTKGANRSLFIGKTKEEILKILSEYVKTTIDFVNDYNSTHKLDDGTPVIKAIDLFNEIVSFDKNDKGEYENIWEARYGISIENICNVFSYAKEHKPEGVKYLYNEPFLEDTKRRKKVLEVLKTINTILPGLIDTLGTQMHITFRTSDEDIEECFKDFKLLQDTQNMNIQITEFDLSLSESEVLKIIGDKPQVSYQQVYAMKNEKINNISTIINDSSVKIDGVSYWSLTDNIDCNLERVRTSLLKKGIISDINEVPTVCGGLFPTSNQYVTIMSSDDKET